MRFNGAHLDEMLSVHSFEQIHNRSMKIISTTKTDTDRFIRLAEVMALLGVKKTTIYKWTKCSYCDFPKPIKLGTSTFWSSQEIKKWMENRKNER